MRHGPDRGQLKVLADDVFVLSPLDGALDDVVLLDDSVLVSDEVFSLADESGLRLSVTYQPEPLKMMPAGYKTRLVGPPQVGQTVIGSSTMRWRTSK